VHDIGLFELLVAAKDDCVIDVAGPPEPVTVSPDASLDEVVERFIEHLRDFTKPMREATRPRRQ